MNFQEESEQVFNDYFNGALSSGEEKELIEWISKSKENTESFAEYCARWELSATAFPVKGMDYEKNRRKLQFRIKPGQKRKHYLKQLSRVAALLIFALVTGFLSYQFAKTEFISKSELSWIEHDTPLGNKSSLVLPDGSLVWLNAGSKVRYTTGFNIQSRKLYLSGEAYFEVKTNRIKPFVVDVSGVEIKATGTKFNVRAYQDEDFIETTLVEGKVFVSNTFDSKSEEISLKPNQILKLYKERNSPNRSVTGKIPPDQNSNQKMPVNYIKPELKTNIETGIYTSWKDNEWIIQKEKFSSLAIKLERRYNVEIQISDSRISELSYTGKLKNETLEQVMKLISQTSPLKYEINGKNVKVWFNEDYEKIN